MKARIKERCAERLLAEPGLQHDEAQAALAATFSVTAIESPAARLDEASLPLFGAAGSTSPSRPTPSPTCSPTSSASAPSAATTGRC